MTDRRNEAKHPLPAVSVIVPVYNIRSMVERCVESLLCQDFRPFEIILVDDGSSDGSAELCDQYAARYNHVQVLHKPNGGLSEARNTGVAAARGSWITFVDGDDYVHPGYLSALWTAADESGAQTAVCTMSTRSLKTIVKKERHVLYQSAEAVRVMLYQCRFDVSVCGKLYRTEIVKKFPFPVGRVYEDVLTSVEFLCNAPIVVYVPQKLYFYVQREDSIAHRRCLQHDLDQEEMTRRMLDYVARFCPGAMDAANSKAFSNYCQILASQYRNDEGEITLYNRAEKFLREHAGPILRDRNARGKNRAAAFLAMVNPSLIARWNNGKKRG